MRGEGRRREPEEGEREREKKSYRLGRKGGERETEKERRVEREREGERMSREDKVGGQSRYLSRACTRRDHFFLPTSTVGQTISLACNHTRHNMIIRLNFQNTKDSKTGHG